MRACALRVLLALAACTGTPGQAQDQAVAVHPSGPTVPANLLRVSVRFAQPPGGAGRPDLALLGTDAARPFVDQDLWSADGRTLTLLFDPSRLKSGVGANLRLGRALNPGQRIALTLDGRLLKAWTVTETQDAGPDPRRWTVTAPGPAGSRASLAIGFDHPVDALSRDLIAVVSPDGEAVPGEAALLDGEQLWRFQPSAPWRPGAYRIAVSPELEDASGNTVAEPFEALAGAGTAPAPAPGLPGFVIPE